MTTLVCCTRRAAQLPMYCRQVAKTKDEWGPAGMGQTAQGKVTYEKLPRGAPWDDGVEQQLAHWYSWLFLLVKGCLVQDHDAHDRHEAQARRLRATSLHSMLLQELESVVDPATGEVLADRTGVVFVVTLILSILATTFTAMRLTSKWGVVKKHTIDDYFTLVAWAGLFSRQWLHKLTSRCSRWPSPCPS